MDVVYCGEERAEPKSKAPEIPDIYVRPSLLVKDHDQMAQILDTNGQNDVLQEGGWILKYG